jgi:TonB family protein
MTYDMESRALISELTVSGNTLTTRSRCEVEPFGGFASDFTVGPRPENMRALMAIPPLTATDGRPMSGRVAVELVVDERGRITGCSARTSSGNADLDRYACQQASERLTMKPAADAAGKPVEGRFRTTIAFSGTG